MKNWRKMLTDIGGYTNELTSVPASSVREMIDDIDGLKAQLELVTLQRDVIVLNWGSRDGQVMAVLDGDNVVAVVWPEIQSAAQQFVRMPTKTNFPSVAHIKAQALRGFAAKVRDDALPGDTWAQSLAIEADRIEQEQTK
jgi:hypothetical protein